MWIFFFVFFMSPWCALAGQETGAVNDMAYYLVPIIILLTLILFFLFLKRFSDRKKKTQKKDERDKKPYIVWEDKYSVNIKELDEQHKKLLDMINELHSSMEVGQGRDVMASITNSLVNYISTHFNTEEKYMVEFSYPDYEKHKEIHRNFVKKTLEFQKDFTEGKLGLSIEVMYFLKNWLLNHIMSKDREYVAFFNDKGLN